MISELVNEMGTQMEKHNGKADMEDPEWIETDIECPKCGAKMLSDKLTRFFLKCSNPNCRLGENRDFW